MKPRWLSFTEARAFVHGLKLRTVQEWRAYCRGELAATKGTRPPSIPAKPEQIYKGRGWKNWPDWLGTDPVHTSKERLAFRRARAFARSLGLKSAREWSAFCAGEIPDKGLLPDDIPADPEAAYPNDWAGWVNWLGIESQERPWGRFGEYMSFPEAKAFVQSLGLKSRREFRAWLRGERPDLPPVPDDFPRSPWTIYYSYGWKNLGDFLGTGLPAPRERRYPPFTEARRFARSLGLSTQAEWFAYCQGKMPELGTRPLNIPSNPNLTYRGKGWRGWGDWLRGRPDEQDTEHHFASPNTRVPVTSKAG